ncbi:hypothetical protein FisN_18Lh173 [Fistulifera solaris]|uniref:Uncharacterized protein n=1 Tax=Fistulifera solaris TaxID=1519565 RepID=A0A1Z5JU34_FISSO|nr:hypothetical protein FisN_18Lh173 [Fistulifera solaris]|eukprot:GAX17527.1 hypothetical protein FisN_18Lh173 [Fistulifera solaris]
MWAVMMRRSIRSCCCRRRRSFATQVLRIGDEYTSREYLLLPTGTKDRQYALASLRAHRNIMFGAKLLQQPPPPEDTAIDEWTLQNVAGPLVERALDDCSAQGEQVQAVCALYGLSAWVTQHWETLSLDVDDISKQAAYAIATGIPRPGHSVVGQGTFRDGAEAWKQLAELFLPHAMESQLYLKHGAQLLHVEHLADTSPAYLQSAGGAMARFLFL